MHPLPATPSRFVRVTSRDADWVQFEFSIGDPDLCVELTMRPAQFDAFRRAQRAIVLAHLPIDQLDRARRHWHDSVPGTHPHD